MADLLGLPQKLRELALRPASLRASAVAPDSAAIRAFVVPELLEKIMLNIDPWTVLHAQRVSLHFQHTILSTPSIKCNLWLDPPRKAVFGEPIVVNPLIKANLSSLGIAEIDEVNSYYAWCSSTMRITFKHRSQLAQLKSGSWSSMFLVDFAGLEDGRLSIWYTIVPGQLHTEMLAGVVENTPPVTLGEIVDALLSMRTRDGNNDFDACFAAGRKRSAHSGNTERPVVRVALLAQLEKDGVIENV